MCAASQQIDVIPNQGHDGTGAWKFRIDVCRPPPLFTLGLTALMQVYWTRIAGSETAQVTSDRHPRPRDGELN